MKSCQPCSFLMKVLVIPHPVDLGHIPVLCRIWMTTAPSNILLLVKLRKRGLKGSMGEKETNFARKELGKPTMTWNYFFITLFICLHSWLWKYLWKMASPSSVSNIPEIVLARMWMTGQWEFYLPNAQCIYTIVLRTVTYIYRSMWMELPRVPCSTVYDYDICIKKAEENRHRNRSHI